MSVRRITPCVLTLRSRK